MWRLPPVPWLDPMLSIEERLSAFQEDVNVAASCFYAWKSINNLAVRDASLFQGLQRNARSWKLFIHSLLVTFVSVLGRLFDRDPRSLSARSFICYCKANLDQFSRRAFEERRLAENHGVRPDFLDEYLSGVYEPVAADFQNLLDALTNLELVYSANYQPIRHKLIAHKDTAMFGIGDSLFAKTNIGDVENILEVLYQVSQVVTQFIINGRQTRLIDHKLREEECIQRDLESLLRKVSV